MAEEKKENPKKGTGKSKRGGDALAGIKIAGEGETKVSAAYGKPNLHKLYEEKIAKELVKELGLKNAMQVPKLQKIVINCAVKEAVGNPKVLDNVISELTVISGQKAILTRAKKSIANFKVRTGLPLGATVTLRRARMYEFMDRLIHITLPRVRDFRGVSTKLDGRGNYSMGIKEQIIFPEINYDKVDSIRGLTITFVTNTTKNDHAKALLTHFGMPFRK